MELEKKINDDIKKAMLAKDARKLSALRAIKAAMLLEKTGKDVSSGVIPETVELKMLQKLVKQRREAAAIYASQNRSDLEEEEIYQAKIIEAYLPAQMSTDEVKQHITAIISELGANSIKDMGKVMAAANTKLTGKSDNQTIASIVKQLLST